MCQASLQKTEGNGNGIDFYMCTLADTWLWVFTLVVQHIYVLCKISVLFLLSQYIVCEMIWLQWFCIKLNTALRYQYLQSRHNGSVTLTIHSHGISILRTRHNRSVTLNMRRHASLKLESRQISSVTIKIHSICNSILQSK